MLPTSRNGTGWKGLFLPISHGPLEKISSQPKIPCCPTPSRNSNREIDQNRYTKLLPKKLKSALRKKYRHWKYMRNNSLGKHPYISFPWTNIKLVTLYLNLLLSFVCIVLTMKHKLSLGKLQFSLKRTLHGLTMHFILSVTVQLWNNRGIIAGYSGETLSCTKKSSARE